MEEKEEYEYPCYKAGERTIYGEYPYYQASDGSIKEFIIFCLVLFFGMIVVCGAAGGIILGIVWIIGKILGIEIFSCTGPI